ncbi:hypothetical protein [Vibrio owensii]|uniref:hypothetical protein n=1 Tax=Vibrio owensii TaxID=696485 RepID=UPI004068C3E6
MIISGFENPTLKHMVNPLVLDDLFIIAPSSTAVVESPNRLLSFGLVVQKGAEVKRNDILLVESEGTVGIVDFARCNGHSISVLGVVLVSIHHYRVPLPLSEPRLQKSHCMNY